MSRFRRFRHFAYLPSALSSNVLRFFSLDTLHLFALHAFRLFTLTFRPFLLEPLGLVKTKCDLSCRDLIAVSYNAPAGRPYGEFDKWCAANRASFSLK